MIRACIVVCTTSFLIGTLATHWIADGLTLWKSPTTDAHLYTSAAYYSLLAQAPREMGIAIYAIVLLGATTILWSLWDGAAGNLMFDGASLFLYGCAIVVYTFSVVPSLIEHFSGIAPLPFSYKTSFPSALKAPTLDLASSHLVCSVALTGVLVLQAGRWWAEAESEEDSTHRASLTPQDANVNVRRRRRSGTPPIDPAEPSSPRTSGRRSSIRRKRLGSTSSGSTGRRLI